MSTAIKMSVCEDCGAKLIGYSLVIRTCDACEAKRWNKAGAQRTAEDIRESRLHSGGRRASEYGNDEIRWPDGLQHY